MTVDIKLLAVARAAESGLDLPPLRLATAAHLITGTPGASGDFEDAALSALQDAFVASHKHLPQAAAQSAAVRDVAAIGEGWDASMAEPEPEAPTTLTIFDALLWAWGEPSGIRLPVTRVRLDAISAWWLGDGEEVKARRTGSVGFFAAISVPIGD